MTEFEAAHEFARQYADAVTTNGPPDGTFGEWPSYWRYCTEQGIDATEERLALARDILTVARGYFACPDEDWDDDEDCIEAWDSSESEPLDGGDLDQVPFLYLAETLECLGWREAFLGRMVRV